MYRRFQREQQDLIDMAISLAWHMRGSLQYHDAFDLTPYERDRISEFINHRLEKEFKKQYPVY